MHRFLASLWHPCGYAGPLPDVALPVNTASVSGSMAVSGLKAVLSMSGLKAVPSMEVSEGHVNGYATLPAFLPQERHRRIFITKVGKRWGIDFLDRLPLPTFLLLVDRFISVFSGAGLDDVSVPWRVSASYARFCVTTMEAHYLADAPQFSQTVPANGLVQYVLKGNKTTHEDPRAQVIPNS